MQPHTSLSQILFLALVFALAVGGTVGASWLVGNRRTRERLQDLTAPAPADSGRWFDWIAALTRPIGTLSAPEEGFEQSSLRLLFVRAGLRQPSTPTVFFGLKTLLTLAVPLAVFAGMSAAGHRLQTSATLVLMLGLASVAYYTPNLVLDRLVRQRQRTLFEQFPDALDLMTVCVEAGLGMDAAMLRVADDLAVSAPVLAEELRLVQLELRAGADRPRALRNLAFRTGVDEIDSFVTMVLQAERFGTSLVTSLRIQADMLRTRRRQQAEEAAAKIALKLLFPLMFCIFPALMVVLMGPAMLQLTRALGSAQP
jgi:tight adherence protein C